MKPAFTVLAAAAMTAAAAVAQDTTLVEIACGCTDCCLVTAIDTKQSNSFVFEMQETEVNAESYSLVVGDHLDSVQLSNMLLSFVTQDKVDCTESEATVTTADGSVARTVPMVNNGDKECLISWDGQFDTAQEFMNKDLYLFYKFSDIAKNGNEQAFAATQPKVFVFPVEAAIVTNDQLTQPNFLVSTFVGQQGSSPGSFETVFAITHNTFTSEDCGFPRSVVMTYTGCGERKVDGVERGEGVLVFVDTMTRQEMDVCAAESSESGTDIVFRMDPSVSFELPDGCETAKPTLPEAQSSIEYNIRSSAGVSDSADLDVNQLVLVVDSVGSVPCDGRVVPMAKVEVTVKMSTSIRPTARRIFDGQAKLDEVNMIRDESRTECTDDIDNQGNHVCYETFVSEECLLMDNNEDDGTCIFQRLGYLDVKAEYEYGDYQPAAFSETSSLKDPLLSSGAFRGDQCADVAVQQDVSSDFPVTLTVEGNNLNNLITSTLSFDDLTDDASVTLKILNVFVTMADGEYSHTFDIADKLALVTREQTPYYRDAHFCRFEVSDDLCRPFYDANSPDRWNEYLQSQDPRFSKPNAGFEGCQDNDARAQDRFAFVPNNWVFNEFGGVVTDMQITVVAEVDTCSTSTSTVSGRRRLQGDDADGNMPIKVTTANVRLTIEQTAASDEDAPLDPPVPDGLPIWIFIVGALAIALIFVLLVLALRRRRRRCEQPASTTDLAVKV